MDFTDKIVEKLLFLPLLSSPRAPPPVSTGRRPAACQPLSSLSPRPPPPPASSPHLLSSPTATSPPLDYIVGFWSEEGSATVPNFFPLQRNFNFFQIQTGCKVQLHMGNNPSGTQAPATAPAPEAAPEKPQMPPAVHQDDADEEDESVKQLGDCSSLYLSLQDCLVKTDRNWKACQKEVQALKSCNDRRKSHNTS
ncbi:hypothetical protein Droror1_Dr00015596 [Drosera rotundifolia]